MSRSEERIGLKSGWFLTVIPYSVSIPMTFGIAIRPSSLPTENEPPVSRGRRSGGKGGGRRPPPLLLEILAGGDDLLDVLLLLFGVAHERLHVDDPLALLAGDLRPVVGVGRIRQILVLLELFAHGIEQVAGADPLLAAADQPLEGQLLGPSHDRLDHGARGEVLEVEDLLVAVGVGHLEATVLLGETVHRFDRGPDPRVDGALGVAAALALLRLGDRDLGRQVLPEDVARGAAIRPLDLDLHVEATRPQDGRIDQVLAVTGADDDEGAQ